MKADPNGAAHDDEKEEIGDLEGSDVGIIVGTRAELAGDQDFSQQSEEAADDVRPATIVALVATERCEMTAVGLMRRGAAEPCSSARILRDFEEMRLFKHCKDCYDSGVQPDGAADFVWIKSPGGNGSLANSKSAEKRARVSDVEGSRIVFSGRLPGCTFEPAERLTLRGTLREPLWRSARDETLDRAAIKGHHPQEQRLRHKSRLMARFNALVRPQPES